MKNFLIGIGIFVALVVWVNAIVYLGAIVGDSMELVSKCEFVLFP